MTPQQQHICQLLSARKKGHNNYSWRAICEIVGANPDNAVRIVNDAIAARDKYNKKNRCKKQTQPLPVPSKWHKVANEKPVCYLPLSNEDSLVSDNLLLKDTEGCWHLGRCMRSREDEYDFIIVSGEYYLLFPNVTEWASLHEFE